MLDKTAIDNSYYPVMVDETNLASDNDKLDKEKNENKNIYLFDCIEKGKSYNLNYNSSSFPTLTLGFNFKPNNILSGKCSATLAVSESYEATVVYQGNSTDLSIAPDDGNGCDSNITDKIEHSAIFKGTSGIETVSGNNVDEYLLSFQEGTFTLSRVHTTVRNLRPIRGDEVTSKAAVDVEQSKRVINSALKKLKHCRRKRKAVELVTTPDPKNTNENEESAIPTAETSQVDCENDNYKNQNISMS